MPGLLVLSLERLPIGCDSVNRVPTRALLVDQELADGVHYAYQFHGDGTFAGFSMGKPVHGAWRITADEFCWVQDRRVRQEECFEVERNGASIHLLRDGYVVFSATLMPIGRRTKGKSQQ
jgi:hypothetical protein